MSICSWKSPHILRSATSCDASRDGHRIVCRWSSRTCASATGGGIFGLAATSPPRAVTSRTMSYFSIFTSTNLPAPAGSYSVCMPPWGLRGSAHESALYAPFTRTNAEFKERLKADDTDATRWLSPTVIARGRKMRTRPRVGHSRAELSGCCHKCRTFEKQRSIKPVRTSKRHESNQQRHCCPFVRARGA